MPPTRRRALRLGAVALAGSLAGCASGVLETAESGTERATTADSREGTTTERGAADAGGATTEGEPTAYPVGADTSLPEGSVEFPAGPKSRPERPADLTAEAVREYVTRFERRWVYNHRYRGESTEIQQNCGVDSVAADGAGFRVVVWCSAWAETRRDGTTVHADYFTRFVTYFVGSDSTVRHEGGVKSRE